MGKLLIGVIIGVALSGLATSVFNSTSGDSLSARVVATDTRARPIDNSIIEPAPTVNSEKVDLNGERFTRPAGVFLPVGTDAGTADATSTPVGSGESLDAREARLREEMEHAQGAVEQASSALQQLMIERMLSENPVVSPTPLPPEFDWVSEELYRGLFHERLQREPIDGAWSALTESELLQFVYERPNVVERYGPPTIRCHTRHCEVLFTTTSGDGAGAEAAVSQLHEESLDRMPGMFDCVDNLCWAEANHQDGVTTIFWGMVINRRDRQPQSLVASASE